MEDLIGEKTADIFLGKTLLEPSNAPVYKAMDYETAQR